VGTGSGVIVLAAVAAAAAGCGADEEYENRPRPPAPINVTAAIDQGRIRVSPQSFGAGPVVFVISNQSGLAQEVTFETDEIAGAQGGIRKSAAVPARSTGTLKVDAREGTYRLSASSQGVRAAAVRVSGRRPSAQDALLQP
jgi:hypothetical protein